MQSATDKIWEADPVHATEDIYRRLLDALAPIARDLLGGGTKGQNNAGVATQDRDCLLPRGCLGITGLRQVAGAELVSEEDFFVSAL